VDSSVADLMDSPKLANDSPPESDLPSLASGASRPDLDWQTSRLLYSKANVRWWVARDVQGANWCLVGALAYASDTAYVVSCEANETFQGQGVSSFIRTDEGESHLALVPSGADSDVLSSEEWLMVSPEVFVH